MSEQSGENPQAAWAYGRGSPRPSGAAEPGVRQTVHDATATIQTIIDSAERAAASIRSEAEDEARRYLEDARRRADTVTAERVRMISELTDELLQQATVVKAHSERMIGALEGAIRTISERLEETEHRAAQLGGQAVPEPPPDARGQIESLSAPSPRPYAPPPPPPPPAATVASEPTGEWASERQEPEHEDDAGAQMPESEEPVVLAGAEAEAELDDADAPPLEPDADEALVDQSPAPSAPGASDPPEEALIKATQLAVAGTDREQIQRVLQRDYGVLDPAPILDRILGPGSG